MGNFQQAKLQRVALLPLVLAWLLNIAAAQTYHCNSTSPCYNGACCGFADGQGICGFGPSYCGKTCISNCSATAECGEYASDPKASCPLNVCCSKYGFCGTTGDFCGDGCQGDNCGDPPVPSCGSNNVMKRVIGYYESWASNRACDAWRPNDIAATALTHANYAFAVFKPAAGDASEWVLEYMHGSDDVQSLVSEFIGLKDANPALSCYLAIGGWAFNDPPTASYWSDMASTAKGRHSFAKAVLNQLEWFGFDGVDLDWEYPVADDRGGKPEDKENFVKLVRELREVLDNSGRAYGITFTAPSSYWYLQHFDIPGLLEAGADWTNIMSYDLHGVWDGTDKWIGSIMQAHTNLTEIKQALGLFWRVGVDPSQIVLGTAFYGRSFTASSSDCLSPGCEFSHGGDKGRCTNATGTLSYKEILEAVKLNEGTVTLDKTAAVNYATWGENQWVSFDTNGTFKTKIDYANEMCLGGVMIWSVDQDTYDWEAMSAMLDEPVDSNNLLTGGSMSDHDAKELSHMYSAYTGTNCYVSDCVDWKSGGQCKTGYSVLDYVHAGLKGMISGPDKKLCKTGSEGDDDAEYRLICCPTDAMPEGCTWEGMRPDGFCTGGQGTCGEDKYELVADKYTDRTGGGFCIMNKRSLCCNANKRLSECSWSGCDGTDPDTPKDGHIFEMVSPYSGSNLDQSSETCDGAEVTYFSCPSKDTLKNCKWYGCDDSCPSSKILITQRTAIDSLKDSMFSTCLTGTNKLCCDPPDGANSAPVDPKNLFKYPDEDDVSYYYKEENSSNEAGGDHHKNDPFAFVMIDGDPEAYSESLVDQWTFLTDDSSLQKRGLKLHRRQNMFEPRNDTFENVVEKYHIQCGSLYANETGCEDIFSGGASNTIVKMPKDVGAGPYARVVSLLPWASDTDTRDEDRLDARSGTDTYELTVDYDLPAASKERKGDVNFRVDYTNLLGYWNDITAAPASKQKRWFGPFDDWLKKITTIVKDEKGSSPLLYEDKVKLFHADKYCPNMNLRATFDIDAQIKLGLNAQYGYYFEGTILPKPSLISAYGYFSIEPDAMILMTLRAEAVMQSNSDVIEILRAGFPGLYIKGLISIGPELVLNGQMDASLSVSGELNAGVAVGWSRTEVYFPPDAAAAAADVTPDEEDVNTGSHSFEPIFNAELEAEGNLALTLSPQVRFGVSVLGDKLMSGYVTAGMSNTISLGMNATASGSHDKSASAGFCYWADYNYKIFLRADMSFLDDLAYWGDQVDLTSPKDSITLVEDTCIKYSSDNELDKRGDAPSLVKNGTDAGCFGGMIACSTVQPSVNTTCKPDPEAKSSPSESSKVKRMPYTCNNKPVMWYNCDYFRDQAIPNGNQNTIGTVGSFKTFWGICHNIKAHLQANMGKPGVGSNYMLLHYLTTSDAEVHKNRRKACGSSKPGNSAQCAREKRDLWPVAVQNAHANQNVPGTQDYKLMAGYSESVSCDEFPFNGSEEGGDEARVECVPVEQQIYQGQINGLLGTIVDTTANPPKKWEDSADPNWGGNDPAYYVTLMYGSIDGNNLGIGGRYSQTNPLEVYRILGGINLMGNPDYAFEGEGDNAICHMDDFGLYLIRNLGIKTISVAPCKVIFVDPPAVPVKRDYNPRDPENWVVKDVELSDDWIERGTTILLDDPSALERDVFGHLKNLAGSQSSKRSTEKDWAEAAEPEERNPHRTSRQEHLRRHRHGGIHGHVH